VKQLREFSKLFAFEIGSVRMVLFTVLGGVAFLYFFRGINSFVSMFLAFFLPMLAIERVFIPAVAPFKNRGAVETQPVEFLLTKPIHQETYFWAKSSSYFFIVLLFPLLHLVLSAFSDKDSITVALLIFLAFFILACLFESWFFSSLKFGDYQSFVLTFSTVGVIMVFIVLSVLHRLSLLAFQSPDAATFRYLFPIGLLGSVCIFIWTQKYCKQKFLESIVA